MRYCPQIPDPWKWIARLVLFFSSSSTHIISSTSINRLQDFKKSSTRLRLMVQRTLHIPSFKRLQRTEKSEKCCSSSCKSISHLFWSEFLRVLESHQQSSFFRFRWRFFNFHIPHHLPVLIIVRKVFKRFPCFTQGNTDMLDNLMDFSPRDKNKLIFSSRAAAARTMVLWEYTNGYLSRCKAGGKQKGKRRIEKTRQKLWWH